jgi:hypothetical protein
MDSLETETLALLKLPSSITDAETGKVFHGEVA